MDPLFATLLESPWPERFDALSAALLEAPVAPWLSRAYYATLVCGALSATDLPSEEAARPYQELVLAFLSVMGLPGRDPVALDVASRHLAPKDNLSPYGHNSPFPYTPPYSLADVQAMLSVTIPEDEAGRAAALKALLTAGDGPSKAAQSLMALWYCAAILDLSGAMGYFIKTAPIQTWPAGRVWPAIGGNPMGVPGPYYGNWAYPPPSPVLQEL